MQRIKKMNVSLLICEIGYTVNMSKPIFPLVLDDVQYAKPRASS